MSVYKMKPTLNGEGGGQGGNIYDLVIYQTWDGANWSTEYDETQLEAMINKMLQGLPVNAMIINRGHYTAPENAVDWYSYCPMNGVQTIWFATDEETGERTLTNFVMKFSGRIQVGDYVENDKIWMIDYWSNQPLQPTLTDAQYLND